MWRYLMSIKNIEQDNQLLEEEDNDIYDDYDDEEVEYEDDEIDDDKDEEEENEEDDEDADDIEYYEESPAYKKAYRKKRRKKRWKEFKISFSFIMIFVILGISALLSISIIYLAKEYMGIDKSSTTYIIDIPEDSSTSEIIDILYDNGIIQVKELFELSLKINDRDGKPIISGEHEISPSMDYGDILDELKTNNQEYREIVTVTFPEGMNVYDAGKLLEENDVCDARSFVYYFNGGFQLDGYNFANYLPTESTLKFLKLEGYLFPDTYEFYKDEDTEIVCRKIFNNFENKITDEYYSRMSEINMSLDEVITLASIVQKESGNVSDMKNIARVFINRLNNPDTFPMLQSDPTRIYAEEVIHVNSDIVNVNMETAYNTYESAGLPPGAICNPGIDAIEAVLYPADSNYFYFCADVETGTTYFAETLEQHNANLELVGIELED